MNIIDFRKRGLPKSTQKAVKDLRTLWQMDFDFRFYKDLRKNYGEKIGKAP